VTARWERTTVPGIYKRTGPEGVAYRVTYRDSQSIQRSEDFSGKDAYNRARARKREVDAAREKNIPLDPTGARVKLADHFEQFARTQPDLAETTLATYESHFRNYIKPVLGNVELRHISTPRIKDMFASEPLKSKGDATRHAVKRLLHRLLQVAVEDRVLAVNACDHVNVRPAGAKVPRILDDDEFDALLVELPSESDQLLVRLIDATGLRISEATALRVGDLKGTAVIVSKQTNRKGTGDVPTKNRRNRIVGVEADLVAELEEFITKERDSAEEFIFENEDGLRVKRMAFLRLVKRAAKRAGIDRAEDMDLHSLRHGAAQRLDGKVGMAVIRDVLGHSSTSVTERYLGGLRSADQAVAELAARRPGQGRPLKVVAG
jgi:integrase